jgi:hypothetical protein
VQHVPRCLARLRPADYGAAAFAKGLAISPSLQAFLGWLAEP